MEKDSYFSIAQVAECLGLSRIAIYNKVKKGQIEAIRIGRSFAISDKTLKELLNKSPKMKSIKGSPLEDKEKKEIDKVVSHTINKYGETLKRLGNE